MTNHATHVFSIAFYRDAFAKMLGDAVLTGITIELHDAPFVTRIELDPGHDREHLIQSLAQAFPAPTVKKFTLNCYTPPPKITYHARLATAKETNRKLKESLSYFGMLIQARLFPGPLMFASTLREAFTTYGFNEDVLIIACDLQDDDLALWMEGNALPSEDVQRKIMEWLRDQTVREFCAIKDA